MKLSHKYFMVYPALVFALFCSSISYASSDIESAFKDLKQLAGIWKVKDSTRDFRIQFELTANNSVLLETWLSKGKKHSLTIYHLDNQRLVATHYCPQGNQPRLQMVEASKPKQLAFEFFDATNLKNLKQSHQHNLAFDLSDPAGTITRSEVYLSDGKPKEDSLVLERVKSKSN